jgi:hypothetical protein
MKTQIILLRIAGGINLFFLFSHIAFNKMFDWEHTLSCLSQINRAILLTYHFICILIIGFMALVSILQTKTLLNSPLKYSVLGFFALFYLVRIITEFTNFGFTMPHSLIIILMCAVPLIFYAIPIFVKMK